MHTHILGAQAECKEVRLFYSSVKTGISFEFPYIFYTTSEVKNNVQNCKNIFLPGYLILNSSIDKTLYTYHCKEKIIYIRGHTI
jgi:hypothetical protein